ncbi:MAG TPA: 16S rRNA (cytosine(1402)-N(4))-methyltransferase, partial [Candidatus Saccharimonadales bacterium]|nr:16S rRNA (cytosine(1402)-N(4))-methyltransferase [Candidatus Saccharimonadales bacterium]
MTEVGPGDRPDDRFHVPVLLEAAVQYWITSRDGTYVDATVGDGGHTQAALGRLGPGARILAIDRDPGALRRVAERLRNEPRVLLKQARFDQL